MPTSVEVRDMMELVWRVYAVNDPLKGSRWKIMGNWIYSLHKPGPVAKIKRRGKNENNSNRSTSSRPAVVGDGKVVDIQRP